MLRIGLEKKDNLVAVGANGLKKALLQDSEIAFSIVCILHQLIFISKDSGSNFWVFGQDTRK